MAAEAVNPRQPRIRVLGRGPADGNGSPVGGGAVWVTSDSGGTLCKRDPADGAVRNRIATGVRAAALLIAFAGRRHRVP